MHNRYLELCDEMVTRGFYAINGRWDDIFPKKLWKNIDVKYETAFDLENL